MAIFRAGNGGGETLPSPQHEPMLPFAAIPLAVAIIGCAGFPATAGGSLYARLGGMQQISAMVEESVGRATAFADQAFARGLALRICANSGGPCAREAAALPADGQRLSAAEFDAVIGSLRSVLERRVGERERNELLRLMAPLRRDIVAS